MAVPERVGRYEVQEVVGELSPAIVLRARDSSNQRVRIHWYETALDPELEELARFGAALERVRKLGPEACVLPIVEWGACDGVPYVVHPDVSAMPASDEVPDSAGKKAKLLHNLACGLAALGDSLVTHGRLWPGTVLWHRDERVALCHFGLPELLSGTRDRVGVVPLNAREIAYMAPEVMRGFKATPASDAWSLALMIWEFLVGPLPSLRETPGQERSLFEVLRRTIEEPFVLPAEHGLGEVLAREVNAVLAAKDPKGRDPGALERLARALVSEVG